MAVIGDVGGIASEATAPYTYLGGEATIHSFDGEHTEQATRFSYRADASRVVYSLVVSGEALKFPDLIATVAGQYAAVWDENAAVAGVTDIAETQEVRPLGGLDDVYNVAVESQSGKTEGVISLHVLDTRPDLFAAAVAAERKTLDAFEVTA